MGILATVVALWFPPVLGGLVIIAAVGVILRVQGSLRAYDALAPTPVRPLRAAPKHFHGIRT